MSEIDDVIDGLQSVYKNAAGLPGLHVYSKVPGTIDAPALVFNVDRVNYDVTMDESCDYVIRGTFFVTLASSDGGQAQLRGYISARGDSSAKLALEANETLDGVVDYAIVDYAEEIGVVDYAGGKFYSVPIFIKVAMSV